MQDDGSAARGGTNSSHWGAFRTQVQDGRLVGVESLPQDPAPSSLLQSIPAAVHAPCRIAQPMVRQAWLNESPDHRRENGAEGSPRGTGPYVPVSWERALDLVAAELERVRREHGNTAIYGGSYGWASAGGFHHAKSQLARFLNCFGGFTDKRDTYSTAAGSVILERVLGDQAFCTAWVPQWPDIIAHTKLMVLFGDLPLRNAQVGPGGMSRHDTDTALRSAHAAGTRFVSISPMRAKLTEELHAEWIAPRPNSDTALMLGLAHVLVTEGLHDRAFLDRYCEGYARVEDYLLGRDDGVPKTPAWAASLTEVPAATIERLARRMAAERTVIACNWALQRAEHGEQPFWMAVTLAALLGQMGLPGGGVGFAYGSIGGIGHPRRNIAAPALPLGRNPTGSFVPVARIADLLLRPGEDYHYNGETRTYPDTRLVYWCGGNPFHHHQDLNRLIRAWQRPETVIVQDPWWTATARHADIVLPATTTLERNDLGFGRRDRTLVAMQQALPPQGQARNDHDIFAALADRVGVTAAFTEGRGEMEWLRQLYENTRQSAITHGVELPGFDAFWELGAVEIPPPETPDVPLAAFRADPAAAPLRTPSGRIELFSKTIAGFDHADCPGHATWLPPQEWLGAPAARDWPLHLLSSQPATRLHGQMDYGPVSQASKVQGREPIWMNPGDAAARGLQAGQVVRVFNARGALLAGLVVTDKLRSGVVQLATGAWYDPLVPGEPGTLEKHGNPNVLTRDVGTSQLAQGPSAQSALVQVERWDAPLPPLTAYDVPALVEEMEAGAD